MNEIIEINLDDVMSVLEKKFYSYHLTTSKGKLDDFKNMIASDPSLLSSDHVLSPLYNCIYNYVNDPKRNKKIGIDNEINIIIVQNHLENNLKDNLNNSKIPICKPQKYHLDICGCKQLVGGVKIVLNEQTISSSFFVYESISNNFSNHYCLIKLDAVASFDCNIIIKNDNREVNQSLIFSEELKFRISGNNNKTINLSNFDGIWSGSFNDFVYKHVLIPITKVNTNYISLLVNVNYLLTCVDIPNTKEKYEKLIKMLSELSIAMPLTYNVAPTIYKYCEDNKRNPTTDYYQLLFLAQIVSIPNDILKKVLNELIKELDKIYENNMINHIKSIIDMVKNGIYDKMITIRSKKRTIIDSQKPEEDSNNFECSVNEYDDVHVSLSEDVSQIDTIAYLDSKDNQSTSAGNADKGYRHVQKNNEKNSANEVLIQINPLANNQNNNALYVSYQPSSHDQLQSNSNWNSYSYCGNNTNYNYHLPVHYTSNYNTINNIHHVPNSGNNINTYNANVMNKNHFISAGIIDPPLGHHQISDERNISLTNVNQLENIQNTNHLQMNNNNNAANYQSFSHDQFQRSNNNIMSNQTGGSNWNWQYLNSLNGNNSNYNYQVPLNFTSHYNRINTNVMNNSHYISAGIIDQTLGKLQITDVRNVSSMNVNQLENIQNTNSLQMNNNNHDANNQSEDVEDDDDSYKNIFENFFDKLYFNQFCSRDFVNSPNITSYHSSNSDILSANINKNVQSINSLKNDSYDNIIDSNSSPVKANPIVVNASASENLDSSEIDMDIFDDEYSG